MSMTRFSFIRTFFLDPRIKKLLVLNVFNAIGFICLNGLMRLLLFPFLSHVLGTNGFGDFLTGFSIANTFAVIPGMALMTALVRSHAGYWGDERNSFFRSMILLALFTGPLCLMLFWISMPLLDPIFPEVDLLGFRTPLALYLGGFYLFTILGGILGSEKKYITKSIFDALAGVLCIAVIPLYYWGNASLACYTLCFAFGIVVVGQLGALRCFWKGRPLLNKAVSGLIVKMAAFYAGISVIDVMLQYGNRWLIGYYMDSSAVSTYYVGMSIALMFCMAMGMVAQLETLIISQRHTVEDIQWKDLKFLMIGLAGLIVILPFLGYIIGKSLMFLLYEDELAQSGMKVFNIFLLLLIFKPLSLIVRPFVVKYCNPRIPLTFSFISAVSSVGLGLFLVPRFGIEGAAIATCIAACLTALMFATKFTQAILLPVYRRHKQLLGTAESSR